MWNKQTKKLNFLLCFFPFYLRICVVACVLSIFTHAHTHSYDDWRWWWWWWSFNGSMVQHRTHTTVNIDHEFMLECALYANHLFALKTTKEELRRARCWHAKFISDEKCSTKLTIQLKFQIRIENRSQRRLISVVSNRWREQMSNILMHNCNLVWWPWNRKICHAKPRNVKINNYAFTYNTLVLQTCGHRLAVGRTYRVVVDQRKILFFFSFFLLSN